MQSLVNRLAGTAYRRLLPDGARNSLRLALALEDRDRPPRLIERLDEPAVVVAPHMDDEVAGVGGTIRGHVTQGAGLCVVFSTDGARGCEHLAGTDPTVPAEAGARARQCTAVRKAESRAACADLGVADLVFLDGPDGSLQPMPALVEALSAVLRSRRPQIIYHPSLFDLHEDHWQTNRLIARCLEAGAVAADVVLRGYEVWTPLLANALVDISDVMDLKERAFARFASQNSGVDYPRAFRGLNAYRSIHLAGGHGFAEAFHETDIPTFRRLLASATARP